MKDVVAAYVARFGVETFLEQAACGLAEVADRDKQLSPLGKRITKDAATELFRTRNWVREQSK